MNAASRVALRSLDLLLAAGLAVMVVLVFGNVVLRYAFNSGITLSEEVSRWLFVWLTFLGALGALARHGHLGTDLLVARFGPRGRRAFLAVAQAVMLVLCALVLQGSWLQTRINLDVAAPVTGASMAWFYGSGVVFGALGIAVLAVQLWGTLSGRVADADLIQVQESEDLAGLHTDPHDPAPAR